MALVIKKPSIPNIKPQMNLPNPSGLELSVTSNQLSGLLSLLSYVRGFTWQVDYYSQLVGLNDELKNYDSKLPAAYQTYNLIKGLVFKVADSISSSQDLDNGVMSATGSAVMQSYLVPKSGDMFIGGIGHRKGLYRLTDQPERKTIDKESLFLIQYELIEIIEPGSHSEGLNDKVNLTYYYHQERLINGLNPIILDSQHDAILTIHEQEEQLVKYYFKQFFNPVSSTLTLPGQMVTIYDKELVNFVLGLVNSDEAPEVKRIKRLSYDSKQFTSTTIWDVIKQRNIRALSKCQRVTKLINKEQFSNNIYLEGFRFQRIDYAVYPLETSDGQNYQLDRQAGMDLDIINPTNSIGNLDNLIKYTNLTKQSKLINSVSLKPYVFSDTFYSLSSNLSLLELVVTNYIVKKPNNPKHITELLEDYLNWGKLEQFYYIPFLILLVKGVLYHGE